MGFPYNGPILTFRGFGDGVSLTRKIIVSDPPYNVFIGTSGPVDVVMLNPGASVFLDGVTVGNLVVTQGTGSTSGTCSFKITFTQAVPLGIVWTLLVQLVY